MPLLLMPVFWDYQSFITAAVLFEPLGFGTTGGKKMGMKEVATFLGHVGSKTSCGYGVATGGPLAYGLCYNHEMSPTQIYCADDLKYPCVDGVEYYGRGAIPVYCKKYNYGQIGEGIKVDLLNHPEYLDQNATLAFQAALWMWMTPTKKKQPSAHDVFVGNWKLTKNDTLPKRLPGFGAIMNVLYGDLVCGQGYINSMNNIISYYQYDLNLMGVGWGHSGLCQARRLQPIFRSNSIFYYLLDPQEVGTSLLSFDGTGCLVHPGNPPFFVCYELLLSLKK